MSKNLKRSGLLAVICVAVLPGVSVAQQYFDPGLLHKTIDRKPLDYQAPGIRMGSFDLKTGAELAYENKDNIFYTNNNEISDDIIHIRPWANLASNWNRHSLNINAFADIGRFSDFDSQDYEDLVFSLDGRFDVKRGSNFNYKASYMQLHEDRSSTNALSGVFPTEFTYSGLGAGYSHQFNRLTAALNVDRAGFDYDNNKRLDGSIIDNQDRDRTEDTITLRADYELSPKNSLFFSAASNSRDYDQKFDSAGFERSSDGYQLRAGMAKNLTGVVTGDLYVQYFDQEYDDPRYRSLSGFGLGGNIDWTPTQLTNVNFRFANGPQETTLLNVSGYYSALYSARVQHEFRRNLLGNVRVSYTDNEYEYSGNNPNALNDTQVLRAGLGISYLFNRNFSLSGGYMYEDQSADVREYAYKTNRWFLTLGMEL